MDAPTPPPTPDPTATASVQGTSNIGTGIANATLNNPNVSNVLGTSTYTIAGYTPVTQPDGSVTQVPRYQQTQTLSPTQQHLYDQQVALGGQENDIAKGALTNVGNTLQQPLGATDPLQTDLGPQGYAEQVKQAQDAAYAQMKPALDEQSAKLDATLASQGIVPGSPAYIQAKNQFGMQVNNAISQSVTVGNDQQRALQAQALAEGQFHNSSQAQKLQMEIAAQNQPINEVTALMSGGQVSMPQFQGYTPSQIAGTPYSQDVYNSANLAQQQYQTQSQQTASNNAALASIAGAGLGMFRFPLGGATPSDPRLKDDHGVVGRVGKIPVHEFNYKGDPTPLRGFMADEVKKVAPKAVSKMKSGFKAVDYAKALKYA